MSGTFGGARPNAGRKPLTDQERQARALEKRQVLVDELLFPALVTAFRCEPGQFKNRYLEVELSKRDIELAYGREGLAEWMSYFSVLKIGGKDRFGNGYKTRWIVNLNKYGVIVKFVEALGHKMKDVRQLPGVFFPPPKMTARVAAVHERRRARQLACSAAQE